MYDGRSGMRGVPRKLLPPDGIIIPRDSRHNDFLGLLRLDKKYVKENNYVCMVNQPILATASGRNF